LDWYNSTFASQTTDRACKPIHNEEVERMPRNNRILAPGARQALDQMKAEIAQEFGVQLGPDTTSRANGSVGGEITKRLVALAEQQMSGQAAAAVRR
jgi:GMP synthase-like glutamine amidotransferase